MNLRLPLALVFVQFIALGFGVEACTGADPFTNDGDGGDVEAGSTDSGKRDSGKPKDSGHPGDSSNNPEGSTTGGDGGITGEDSSVITPPGFDASIYCGPVICESQFCCGSGLADGGVPATYACENVGSTCSGVKENCDDMIDCRGKMCCATVAGGHVTAIGCATSCGAGLRVCDPGVATDCSSTGGGTCTAMTQLPGSNQYYCK